MRSRQKKRTEAKAMENLVRQHGTTIRSLEKRVTQLHEEIVNNILRTPDAAASPTRGPPHADLPPLPPPPHHTPRIRPHLRYTARGDEP